MKFANHLDNDCIHNIRTEQKRSTALSGKVQVNVMVDEKHDMFCVSKGLNVDKVNGYW